MRFNYFLLGSILLHVLLFWQFADSLVLDNGTTPNQKNNSHAVSLQFSQEQEKPKDNISENPKIQAQEKKEERPEKSKTEKTEQKKHKTKDKKQEQQTQKSSNTNNSNQKQGIQPSSPKPETNSPPSTINTEEHPLQELTIGQKNAPQYTRFSPPEYPYQARQRNIQGLVLLRVFIDEQGKVQKIEVMQSPHPLLTKAAKKAVQKSTYQPASRAGIAIASWVQIPIRFQLK